MSWRRRLAAPMVGLWRNGETRVKLEENVRGSDVFAIQSMSAPVDHHLMELLLIIDALRRASAARITAVIPYFAYAKQEKKTSGREPISAKLVANLLTTAGANRILTMDLHSPAIEGFFDIPVDHLRAAPILARHINRQGLRDLAVVSPDAGGVARAEELRGRTGGSLAIISKRHPGPDVSEALEMVGDVCGKPAVIVDDMISTGGTLALAAELLKERGASPIYAAATHGIFAQEGLELDPSVALGQGPGYGHASLARQRPDRQDRDRLGGSVAGRGGHPYPQRPQYQRPLHLRRACGGSAGGIGPVSGDSWTLIAIAVVALLVMAGAATVEASAGLISRQRFRQAASGPSRERSVQTLARSPPLARLRAAAGAGDRHRAGREPDHLRHHAGGRPGTGGDCRRRGQRALPASSVRLFRARWRARDRAPPPERC